MSDDKDIHISCLEGNKMGCRLLGRVEGDRIYAPCLDSIESLGLCGGLELGVQYSVHINGRYAGTAIWGGIHAGEDSFNDVKFRVTGKDKFEQIGTKYEKEGN
jgi:hypothetical protein